MPRSAVAKGEGFGSKTGFPHESDSSPQFGAQDELHGSDHTVQVLEPPESGISSVASGTLPVQNGSECREHGTRWRSYFGGGYFDPTAGQVGPEGVTVHPFCVRNKIKVKPYAKLGVIPHVQDRAVPIRPLCQ